MTVCVENTVLWDYMCILPWRWRQQAALKHGIILILTTMKTSDPNDSRSLFALWSWMSQQEDWVSVSWWLVLLTHSQSYIQALWGASGQICKFFKINLEAFPMKNFLEIANRWPCPWVFTSVWWLGNKQLMTGHTVIAQRLIKSTQWRYKCCFCCNTEKVKNCTTFETVQHVLHYGFFSQCRFVFVSVVKPTRCTKVSNLFYFGMTHYMFQTAFPPLISSSRLYIQLSNRHCCLFDKCLLLYVQSWTADDGRKVCPKHVVSFQNKFDTLMHLVGFTIEIYYDARPYECQICFCLLLVVLCALITNIRVKFRVGICCWIFIKNIILVQAGTDMKWWTVLDMCWRNVMWVN